MREAKRMATGSMGDGAFLGRGSRSGGNVAGNAGGISENLGVFGEEEAPGGASQVVGS